MRDYSIAELEERARYMRGLNEIALCSAASGHSGGTLGIMDICAALYLKIARHCPSEPDWSDRDRIIWSAGHKAPALYTALAVSGYYDERELMKLRMLDAPFQGHPHRKDLRGVEISSGSLGQGFSVGVGVALAAKLDHKDYRTFVICSDGEQQEGSMWESAMAASYHRLDNLIVIIDQNRLQIDGEVKDVLNIEPLEEKYRAFGWEVLHVDGHAMTDIVAKLDYARNHHGNGKPIALICRTNKGRGVSFMENAVGWHGKPPNREELDRALVDLGLEGTFDVDALLAVGRAHQEQVERRLATAMPKFSRDYWWNRAEAMRVDMEPTRQGFGRALAKYGDDERVICIGADISDSITISEFYKNNPERKNRFISVGVAEQNATTIAAGLAKEGKLPVFGTYGVFASARNLDQLRVSVCYGDYNVFVVGAHGGISVGPDGATHQELESMFQICGLPNMRMAVPCDALETERMTQLLLFDVIGPKYLRFAREATPVLTTPQTPLQFGEANIYRFRREARRFIDAFSVTLSTQYEEENEDISIISCGPETAEALRAAYILKQEYDVETRVVHLHTVKPLDEEAVGRAALETGAIITAEEHQVGGLGNRVAGAIAQDYALRNRPIRMAMIGIRDSFGESGKPWQLIRRFGVAAEHIAERAKTLLKIE
ncbi:transketolase [candidate division GN15 bacterium]|nr:transketolase [candidate division GN15 bacterium]